MHDPQEDAAGLGYAIASQVLHAWYVHLHEGHGHGPEHVKSLLQSLETISTAFVVFPTQSARNQALEKASASGVRVGGIICSISESHFHVTTAERSWKMRCPG